MRGLTFLGELKFGADGLIPAIVQDAESGQVLMVAYMNREALERTWETGETWFYSRSRQELWHKGETSGHTQKVRGISFDCDQDALLVKVEQIGAACHEGYATCFFREVDGQGNLRIVEEPVFDPLQVYKPELIKPTGPALTVAAAAGAPESIGTTNTAGTAKAAKSPGAATEKMSETTEISADPAGTATAAPAADAAGGTAPADGQMREAIGGNIVSELYQVILERQQTRPEGSYTAYLFNKGIDKICKKVGEEAAEVIIAAKNRSREELVYESADLIYHLLVLLAEGGIKPAEVLNELAKRR